ncbi:uncharacterized protein V6R79_019399 [Siganus canaliculatus]
MATVKEARTKTVALNLFKQDVKQATGKVKSSKREPHVYTHGLHHLHHVSCESPVRFMMYSEVTASFISLHLDNRVCLYKADDYKQTPSVLLPFMGLTDIKISGNLVGWGPGSVFALLDSELRLLGVTQDALDICVCQAAEHSSDVVTAGTGNVCVWSVLRMRCEVKIQEGLQQYTFTQMALAPPQPGRPYRAFVSCENVVTVVNLDAGKVLEHRRNLCSQDITAMVYYSQQDCLIIASKEPLIHVWGPDWKLRATFAGHTGEVNTLFYCPTLSMLLSASVDCTIRWWNVEEDDAIERVHTQQKSPPLCIGGNTKADTFFTFTQKGVDFWTIRTLYTLHCKLKGDEGVPLRQILVSPVSSFYPVRVVCLSGDSDVMLVAAETGALLTSFTAKQKIVCADYCLHKEMLFALTETGSVLQANTLTNPVTLMQEWKKIGQGLWPHKGNETENNTKDLPDPGPACCLVLYSHVADAEKALEDWMSLQDRRGCSQRDKIALDDAKNKFSVILGHVGGYVSVLKMDKGQVLYQKQVHHGQRVTSLKAYPEHSYLVSAGEDLIMVMWSVNPYAQEFLSPLLTLNCDQPPVHLVMLGPQLAMTFQDPNCGTYNLMHFHLLNQSRSEYSSEDGHLDRFTGLCVSPNLDVFVTSSLDRTVSIWDERNHLIGKLRLNAVPQCLAYGGFGDQLFLGIRGDLYRMSCAKFLPQIYQQMMFYTCCSDPVPDLPIIEQEKCSKLDLFLLQYTLTLIQNMNKDVDALLHDLVKCRKDKPIRTKETRKEAFDGYMKLIYRLPPKTEVDFEDDFQFNLKPLEYKPYVPPPAKAVIRHEPKVEIPVAVVKKKKKKPQEEPTPPAISLPQIPIKAKPKPVRTPKKPVVEKKEEEPPKITPSVPKPKLPSPPPRRLKIVISLPGHEPGIPAFLKQFEDTAWFKDMYPDKKCIPSPLSPDDFSLQLLSYLDTITASSQIKILNALQLLNSQGHLQNTDKLYQGLTDMVPKVARPQMSPVERTVLVEILNLLISLKSVGFDLMKMLLALLAFQKLRLRKTLLNVLTGLGVNEAEQWLWPELKSWGSELQQPSDIWRGLYDKADWWLELWISNYKVGNTHLSRV